MLPVVVVVVVLVVSAVVVVSLLFFFFFLDLFLSLPSSSSSTSTSTAAAAAVAVAVVDDGVLVFAGGPLGRPCTSNEVDIDDVDVSSNVADTENPSSKPPGWVMFP